MYSNATYNSPVRKLPVLSCARRPRSSTICRSNFSPAGGIQIQQRLGIVDLLPLRHARDQHVGEERDQHPRMEGLGCRLILQPDSRHFADAKPVHCHRRADRQSAHRLVEVQHEAPLDWVRLLQRRQAIAIDRERMVLGRRRGERDVVRRIEGHAAGQQRRQRLGAHIDAIGADRHVDAARVPEACLGGDIFVVGRVDEHRDVHRPAVGDQVGGRDLADLQAAVIDRIADAQRTELAGFQDEAPAGLVPDRRRFVQATERALVLGRLAGLELDVVARQQRVQSGHAAQGDARFHDPELGVLDHQARRVLGDLRPHQHLGIIRGQLHRRNQADAHVLVLDERLARLDAAGGLEFDGDGGSLAYDALDGNPDGNEAGKNRNQPDDREAHAPLAHDDRLRKCIDGGFVSHGHPDAVGPSPRSTGDRTFLPRTS